MLLLKLPSPIKETKWESIHQGWYDMDLTKDRENGVPNIWSCSTLNCSFAVCPIFRQTYKNQCVWMNYNDLSMMSPEWWSIYVYLFRGIIFRWPNFSAILGSWNMKFSRNITTDDHQHHYHSYLLPSYYEACWFRSGYDQNLWKNIN